MINLSTPNDQPINPKWSTYKPQMINLSTPNDQLINPKWSTYQPQMINLSTPNDQLINPIVVCTIFSDQRNAMTGRSEYAAHEGWHRWGWGSLPGQGLTGLQVSGNVEGSLSQEILEQLWRGIVYSPYIYISFIIYII